MQIPAVNPILFWCLRRTCKQKEWKVPTVSRSARFFPTSSATRSRISAAALLVKVIANTSSGGTPFASRCAIRTVITRVFPVPAPASTRTGPFVVVTAWRCSALSRSRVSFKRGLRRREREKLPVLASILQGTSTFRRGKKRRREEVFKKGRRTLDLSLRNPRRPRGPQRSSAPIK